jgi:hypothetical protein
MGVGASGISIRDSDKSSVSMLISSLKRFNKSILVLSLSKYSLSLRNAEGSEGKVTLCDSTITMHFTKGNPFYTEGINLVIGFTKRVSS